MGNADVDVVAERDPGAGLAGRRVSMGQADVMVGPVAHLAAERQRLESLRWEHFEARQLGATIGAVIEGVDLTSPLPDEVVRELRQALVDYKVLFFREQPLTAGQHVAFARGFGDLEVHPFIPGNPDHPELVRFAKSADAAGYENAWHSDVSWRERPSMGAILHAIEVPASGGDTLFADMYAAYDGLDQRVRDRVEGLVAVHDFMKAFAGQVPPERRDEMRATYPLVTHPVVRTHGETGRQLLYVNRVFVESIVGVSDEESGDLIDLLSRQAGIIEYQCRWHWEPHSVAFWDNRAVQHYACSDYWPSVRIMERASIIGERPR